MQRLSGQIGKSLAPFLIMAISREKLIFQTCVYLRLSVVK